MDEWIRDTTSKEYLATLPHPERSSSLPEFVGPRAPTALARSRSQHHSQHDIEFAEFELPPPLPPRPQPQTQLQPHVQALPQPEINVSLPRVPSRSMYRTAQHKHNQAAVAGFNTSKRITTASDQLSDSERRILATLQNYLNVPQLTPAPASNGTTGPGAIDVQANAIPTSFYDQGTAAKGGTCKENVNSGGAVAGQEAGGERENKKKGRRCCCCKMNRKRVLIALRVLSCMFGITMLVCNIMILVERDICWAGICVAPLLLLFNSSVLTTQRCMSRKSRLPSAASTLPDFPKTWIYTIVIIDFHFAIALMVLGMVSLIKGIVNARTYAYASWGYTNYYYEDVLDTLGGGNGVPEQFMGGMWLVVGLVEGATWGVGAAGIWK